MAQGTDSGTHTFPDRFAAIILCPCCATAVDAECTDGHPQNFECVACGQNWTMTPSRERQAAHSLN